MGVILCYIGKRRAQNEITMFFIWEKRRGKEKRTVETLRASVSSGCARYDEALCMVDSASCVGERERE
jgi:hypothetical protein